ncbi:D-beta-hydroxybutyrate dehydrogenase, mitochondrial [Toxorhynchites rutilus septentrionalis]|uniref:D-beta-hydroxybutyrate dehydrogenase, mitochondrial n=1 Tax=Toxorhynchites rutilus septentrionalis TaxID=329112 RepID=UPI00247889F1|nr:D-beta-hydroxybutyrate dehydrogenase, mitochondrial [Toxorhynchites rutilus septentrionalis]
MASVSLRGDTGDLLKYVGLSTVAAGLLLVLLSRRERRKRTATERSVVFVTGCDSGLGFNVAKQCHRLGFTVFAGCLNVDSEGASLLKEVSKETGRLVVLPLNITLEESIMIAHKMVKDFLAREPEFEFYALINNAGVMCFGEFEWQLVQHIEQQIGVNLLGTMKVTKAFLPLIRRQRARLINVTSHCSLQALPGLSVYSASKAALRYWNEALRMELSYHGVDVVNFIPGSLVMQTNISANQQVYATEMAAGFSEEQRDYYGRYFEEYNAYLSFISGVKPVQSLPDDHFVVKSFTNALLDEKPALVYKCEPWRYKVYHFLFRNTPVGVSDWLVRKFITLPVYKPPHKKETEVHQE